MLDKDGPTLGHGRGHSNHRHSDRIIATPIESSPSSSSSEAQAAWARPLQSSTSSSLLRSRWSLSLFWWLVILIIGGWVDGGRLIRLWVWDLGWYWCLSLGWSGWLILVDRGFDCSVCLSFFFFSFGSSGWYWWSVVDLWGGRWLWVVAIDLRCGLLLLLLLLMIMEEGKIYYFNL